MTNEQLEELAMGIAMRFHLSDYNYEIPAVQAFDSMGEDDNTTLWEPFEYWEIESVKDSIKNLADDVKQTFAEVLDIQS